MSNEDRNSREEAPRAEWAQRPSLPSSPPVRPGGQADQCGHRLWSHCPHLSPPRGLGCMVSLPPWCLCAEQHPGGLLARGPSCPPGEHSGIAGPLSAAVSWPARHGPGWGPSGRSPGSREGCHCPSWRPPSSGGQRPTWGPLLPAGPHHTAPCHSSSSFFPVPYAWQRGPGSTHVPTQPHRVALALGSPMARVQVPAPPHTGGCARQGS